MKMDVLIFHRIIDSIENKITGEITTSEFEKVISRLVKFFHFDSLNAIAGGGSRYSLLIKHLAITFDDGYADNFDVALPILQQHNVGATFFIASGYLNGGWMWNDGIVEAVSQTDKPILDLQNTGYDAYPVTTDGQKKICIDKLLNQIKYLPTDKRPELAKRILEVADVPEPCHLMMTDEQVKKMHQAGMEIGGHTVNHPILTSVDKGTARREIFENKEYLEHLIGEPLHSFAYPNGKPGKDYGPEHVALVKEAGYKCAVSTAWGRVNKNSDPFQLPRFTPWDRNPWKFMLRLWLQR